MPPQPVDRNERSSIISGSPYRVNSLLDKFLTHEGPRIKRGCQPFICRGGMTDLIKPCPFCGGATRVGWFAMEFNIDCPACRISLSRHAVDFNDDALATKAACITAWNTRAEAA